MESEREDKEIREHVQQLVQSCNSLSKFDDKGFRVLIPQIAASFIAILYHIVIGISFAYSAILIPQLLDAQNTSKNINSTETVILVTETDIAWIASVLPTVVLPASVIGGILIDSIGRLNTLKLAAIPNSIGWILIAVATNVPMLVVGRLLTGTSIALGVSPAIIYATEISAPKIRGALVAIGPCLVSLGMMLTYLEGWFLNWKTVAWICLVYTIVPIILVQLWVPESPMWLISKNRKEQAKKSLEQLNKYRKSNYNLQTYTEVQLSLLQKEHILKQEQQGNINGNSILKKLKMFKEPTVYKPLIILSGLYFFQQFSGLFIMLFYTVSFFNEVGTNISAYLAAVLVGAVRFLMSIVAIILMRRYSRRYLIILSALGMSLSIGISGLFTSLVKEGKTTLNWIPTSMILLYVASSMVGFLGIPWTVIGELFPTSVRGLAHSISFGIAHIMMFASIQLYFSLIRLFGGLVGLQYFFSAIAFSGAAYCYIFLPETHNKKLSEVEEYFRHHWTYFSLRSSEMEVNEQEKCVLSLNTKTIPEEKKQELIGELYHSTILNYREDQRCKVLLPQITAAGFAYFFHFLTGQGFAFSAILIPQLIENQNQSQFNMSNGIYVTESDNSWIASVFSIVVPVSSIAAGFVMDAIGRVNTLKLAAIPSFIGWTLIATATSIPMLITGRILTGISSAFGVGPAIGYVSEISRPDIRGALTSLGPTITSLGMMIAYLEGWFLNWRWVAWLNIGYTIAATAFVLLIPESPAWLVTKNQTDRALKSLEWLNKYHPKPEYPMETIADTQLALLKNETFLKRAQQIEANISKLKMFLEPTVYKPMLIITFLYVFVNFSGIYITLCYAVSFFEEVGTSISPYMASVEMGAARFIMSIATVWLTGKYNRRTLITVSTFCMATCMGVSAFYTNLIKEGSSNQAWVPVLMLLLYTASTMIGFLGIPMTITGELFPTAVRGVALSIAYGIFNLLMFASLRIYYTLNRLCGGVSGLQYFFAAVSLGGMIYSYVFLPETHNKKLSDMEEYFMHNTTYIFSKRSKSKTKENITIDSSI